VTPAVTTRYAACMYSYEYRLTETRRRTAVQNRCVAHRRRRRRRRTGSAAACDVIVMAVDNVLEATV